MGSFRNCILWNTMMLFVALAIVIGTRGEEEWFPMPDGKLYHRDCIHVFEEHFEITPDEETPCIHAVREQDPPERLTEEKNHIEHPEYYSDWSVYTQQVTHSVTSMSSTWTVPPAPKANGPAGLGSIFIFNGLEDGAGHHGNSSFILQPVLQYGKSGCLNDPRLWHQWHMTAYFVTGAGR